MTASDAKSPCRDAAAQPRAKHDRDVGITLASEHPGRAVVPLPAEFDICIADQVGACVSSALDCGASVLVADASRTTFCDCAGVRALIETHLQALESGVQLRIAASPEVRRILQLTGADEVLDTYGSVADALAGTARPARRSR